MVSFYCMPIYYRVKDDDDIAPALLKCLREKASFNVKKENRFTQAKSPHYNGKGQGR
jgi:hypothetical protein